MNFIEEFHQLLLEKPRHHLKQVNVENSDFADIALNSRNAYYCFGIFYGEDVLYTRYSRQCASSSDLTFCFGCQWCYECVNCSKCYMSDYSRDCQDCVECRFCIDCYACSNCFGCANMYRKQYCFFNEQLSKEEYEKRIIELDINDPKQRHDIEEKVRALHQNTPTLPYHHFQTEDSIGDHLSECKESLYCFDIMSSEYCFYNIEANGNKNCCDITTCFQSEWCYNCVLSPLNYNCNFCFQVDTSSDSEFCAFSRNLKHCFGCVYLDRKEYCILNKPYAPEAYAEEVLRIKQELIRSGQYNLKLFFLSAYELMRMRTEEEDAISSVFPTADFGKPASVRNCKNCSQAFVVIAPEEDFYDQKGLPKPDDCPTCRHRYRMALRSERKLYRRTCAKCTNKTITIYPPDAPYSVYCQKCFWENIG